ncbi:MAG: ATP-binding protein [Thermoguttaceae bacterium]|jgi:hypothetical protein
MEHQIIPQHLSILAMRSSGYRDAAHAVAELIDNSIQAGLGVNSGTNVEVLCVDSQELVNERRRRRISEVAVYDNACGMDAETLRIALQFGNGTHLDAEFQDGIGKFGMGLPNSSISQCRRVDVWTWQNAKCLHSYLDVDEIANGTLVEVPEPEESEFPKRWLNLVRDELGPHGTLVLWSKLDRIRWKTSKSFLENAEFLVGRMYRYYLSSGRAQIRMAAFQDERTTLQCTLDADARPNDPLGLMMNTVCPDPWSDTAPFERYGDVENIDVFFRGQEHRVEIEYSICKTAVRREGGSAPIGRWAAKNQGVSVVRAHRELEINRSFDIHYDPRERWWGVEVRFPPALDELFGVTNNKQAATAFGEMDLEEDAKFYGLSKTDFEQQLRDDDDPRRALYTISQAIRSTLSTLRQQIKRMRDGAGDGAKRREPSPSEDIATRATKRRQEEQGIEGTSDTQERTQSEEDRRRELESELIEAGHREDVAKEIAVEYVKRNIKFLFERVDFPGAAIFDVKSKAGTIIVRLNTRHPASDKLFDLIQSPSEDASLETPALTGLKLLLTAWARMEDEANEPRRIQLEDTRVQWGTIARDFLMATDE